MRYFPMILAAGLLSAGLLSGSGPAHAMPALALDRSAVADTTGREGLLLPPIRPAALSPQLLRLWQ